MLRVLTVMALLMSLVSMSACVVAPAPGYYGRGYGGGYGRPVYRPYYRRW